MSVRYVCCGSNKPQQTTPLQVLCAKSNLLLLLFLHTISSFIIIKHKTIIIIIIIMIIIQSVPMGCYYFLGRYTQQVSDMAHATCGQEVWGMTAHTEGIKKN